MSTFVLGGFKNADYSKSINSLEDLLDAKVGNENFLHKRRGSCFC